MADPYSNKKGAGRADPDISQGYINSGLVFVICRTNGHLLTCALAVVECLSEAAGTVQS